MKKVLIVHNREVDDFPPVKSLIEALINNGYKVTIITRDKDDSLKKYGNKIKLKKLISFSNNKLGNMTSFLKNRRLIRSWTEQEMEENDVIWTTTDATVREIGPILLKYKHIMQLMELVEYVPRFPKIPKQELFKFDIQRYARQAWKVVVPEENRAYIQKTWWNLKTTPVILPNKPYNIKINDSKLSQNIIDNIKMLKADSRIKILYQGVFYKDRKLDEFAKAIEKKSDKYCLYIMGRENDYSRILQKKYPHVRYLSYVTPPKHLEITKEADIGLLPYFPTKIGNNSVLNALYCAPNKLFEYAAFGKPMLGTDVLGLKFPFKDNFMGYTVSQLDEEEILKKLDDITDNYQTMSVNAKKFFDSVDWDKKIKEILN